MAWSLNKVVHLAVGVYVLDASKLVLVRPAASLS